MLKLALPGRRPLNLRVNRQGAPVLLQTVILLEWMILVPCAALTFVGLLLVIMDVQRRGDLGIALGVLGGLVGMALLNLACWRQASWALWLRAGVCFLAASWLFRVGFDLPGLFVLSAERTLQAGLAVWLAFRGQT